VSASAIKIVALLRFEIETYEPGSPERIALVKFLEKLTAE
jgi:hypothetical protein